MINVKILYYILIIFLIVQLISCDDEYIKIEKSLEFNENYAIKKNENHSEIENSNNDNIAYTIYYDNNTEKTENIYFSNFKILKNEKNEYEVFHNYPRKNVSLNKATFTKYNNDTKQFEPWPHNFTQNITNETNCSSFISIIDFAFDDDNNIYVLDEGNETCPIKVSKIPRNYANYSSINNYTIIKNNSENISLSDFVIDTKKKFLYITYLKKKNSSDEIEYGIYVKNMSEEEKDNNAKNKEIINYDKLKPDDEYRLPDKINNFFKNIKKKIINIALSCDSTVVFLSPFSSRKIFSFPSEALHNKSESLDANNFTEAYKNDLTTSVVAGSLGNLYFTGIENNIFYRSAQFDDDLSLFDYKGLNPSKSFNNDFLPIKLSINNGRLFSVCKDITDKIGNDSFVITTRIYESDIDKEKSYLYKCEGLNYKWNMISYIVWLLFCFILCFILLFVFVENKQDKGFDNKKNNEEEIILKKNI